MALTRIFHQRVNILCTDRMSYVNQANVIPSMFWKEISARKLLNIFGVEFHLECFWGLQYMIITNLLLYISSLHTTMKWFWAENTVSLCPCVFPGRETAYVGMSLKGSAGDRALLPLLSHICTVHGFAIMQQFSVAKTVILLPHACKCESVFLSALPVSEWLA